MSRTETLWWWSPTRADAWVFCRNGVRVLYVYVHTGIWTAWRILLEA